MNCFCVRICRESIALVKYSFRNQQKQFIWSPQLITTTLFFAVSIHICIHKNVTAECHITMDIPINIMTTTPMQITWPLPQVGRFSHDLIVLSQKEKWTSSCETCVRIWLFTFCQFIFNESTCSGCKQTWCKKSYCMTRTSFFFK